MKYLFFLTLSILGTLEGFGQKPNIIYLMADDQNVGSVGCYGNAEVLTPVFRTLVELKKWVLKVKELWRRI